MNKIEQIRIHGRGGQGVVTAAELIAMAAFYDGLEAQAFPNFGVERSGAPIQSYARISEEKILTREQVYTPSVLIIQDSSLLDTNDLLTGTTEETKIIINAPENRWSQLEGRKNVFFTPATEIALEVIGRNIVNTVILGAFVKETKLISLASLKKAVRVKFKEKGDKIINKNIEAIEKVHNL